MWWLEEEHPLMLGRSWCPHWRTHYWGVDRRYMILNVSKCAATLAVYGLWHLELQGEPWWKTIREFDTPQEQIFCFRPHYGIAVSCAITTARIRIIKYTYYDILYVYTYYSTNQTCSAAAMLISQNLGKIMTLLVGAASIIPIHVLRLYILRMPR